VNHAEILSSTSDCPFFYRAETEQRKIPYLTETVERQVGEFGAVIRVSPDNKTGETCESK
jgi:hypothetical protein